MIDNFLGQPAVFLRLQQLIVSIPDHVGKNAYGIAKIAFRRLRGETAALYAQTALAGDFYQLAERIILGSATGCAGCRRTAGRKGIIIEIAGKFEYLNAKSRVGNRPGNHRIGAGLVDIVLRGNQIEVALIKK